MPRQDKGSILANESPAWGRQTELPLNVTGLGRECPKRTERVLFPKGTGIVRETALTINRC